MAGVGPARRCTEPEAAAAQYAAADPGGPGRQGRRLRPGRRHLRRLRAARRPTADSAPLGTAEGVEHLGGVDFDEAVLRHVLAALSATNGPLDPDDPEVTVGAGPAAPGLRRGQGGAVHRRRHPGPGRPARLEHHRADHPGRVRADDPAGPGRDHRSDEPGPPQRPGRTVASCAASCWSAAAPGSPWSARCCTASSPCPPPSTPTPSTTSPSDRYASVTRRPTPSPRRPTEAAPPPRPAIAGGGQVDSRPGLRFAPRRRR